MAATWTITSTQFDIKGSKGDNQITTLHWECTDEDGEHRMEDIGWRTQDGGHRMVDMGVLRWQVSAGDITRGPPQRLMMLVFEEHKQRRGIGFSWAPPEIPWGPGVEKKFLILKFVFDQVVYDISAF